MISRKVRKVRKLSAKAKFPVIPVRGLWDQATTEEQAQARQVAQVIMEYWMGRLTKKEATERLGMRPVRFWQMSNQAIAGMTAGLLTQPRYKKNAFLPSNEVTELRAKVGKLEAQIDAQQRLIDVLRSIPGNSEVEVNDETTRKSRVPRGSKKPRGAESVNGKARRSGDSGQLPEGDDANLTIVEGAGQSAPAAAPART